jgi:hypothetical protein
LYRSYSSRGLTNTLLVAHQLCVAATDLEIPGGDRFSLFVIRARRQVELVFGLCIQRVLVVTTQGLVSEDYKGESAEESREWTSGEELALTQRIERIIERVPIARGDALAPVVRLVLQDSPPLSVIPGMRLRVCAQRRRDG